jgi:hypothetical protein
MVPLLFAEQAVMACASARLGASVAAGTDVDQAVIRCARPGSPAGLD